LSDPVRHVCRIRRDGFFRSGEREKIALWRK
jgi:hypothetical protein